MLNNNKIENISVIGAGTMGHAIALVFARYGYEVRLWCRTREEQNHAATLIITSLNSLAALGQIEETKKSGIYDNLEFSTNLETAASEADFIIESVVEVPEIKKEMFSRLDKICSEKTIFSSNTSGLDIFDILDINYPERLIITHWFSPPTIIPLVEVIPGPDTSEEVINSTLSLLESVQKRTVRLKQFVPAFIVNRIQDAINKSVLEIIDNGWASPEDIDFAVKNTLGIKLPVVGVVQSMDFTGLDLIRAILQRHGVKSPFLEELVSEGRLGAKSSKGIYDYQNRQENEIIQKRDDLYLKTLSYLEKLGCFKQV